jgi:hypothetical protein
MSGDYNTWPDFSTTTACCDGVNIYCDYNGVANGVIYYMYHPVVMQILGLDNLLGEPVNLHDLLSRADVSGYFKFGLSGSIPSKISSFSSTLIYLYYFLSKVNHTNVIVRQYPKFDLQFDHIELFYFCLN